MFIRKATKIDPNTQKAYHYLCLVQSIRTPKGPRQKTILNLGDINIPDEQFQTLATCIEDKLNGATTLFDISYDSNIATHAEEAVKRIVKMKLIPPSAEVSIPTDVTPILANSIKVGEVRSIGPELVCLDIWNKYSLDEFFAEKKIESETIALIKAQIIGRMIFPGSDLSTWDWLNNRSGLLDLINIDSKTSLSSFYRAADILLRHKNDIESHLKVRSDEIFKLKRKLCLLDLTNTYFEGAVTKVSKAKRGRSKEKRSDCKIITIGMMIDENGFPECSRFFEGNISEPKTMSQMLDAFQVNSTAEAPTIIMDAGIATKENVEFLATNGYQYIVVSRSESGAVKKEEMTFLKKSANGNDISVKRLETEKESLLYCHSSGRELKETSIIDSQTAKFVASLEKLKAGLESKKGTKDFAKVMEMIGRARGKYPKASKAFTVTVEQNENKKAVKITWEKKEIKQRDPGVYLLRTNRKSLGDEDIWDTYVMLTRIEQTYRTIKSDTGLRPVFHRTEKRVDAHIFISLLAYHLINAIEYQLRANHDHRTWATIRETLYTHSAVTIKYHFQDQSQQTFQAIVRSKTEPEEQHKLIYEELRLNKDAFIKSCRIYQL